MSELLVTRAGGVLSITIDAPERLNAVDTPLVHAIADEILDSSDVRVAVMTGSGRAFSSGAKLSADGPNVGILDAAFRLITAMTSAPYPVVAAVNGVAAGIGCSIALAADLIVASERSFFLQAFVRIGLMPDGGANELLSASIGRARAMWLAMSGEKVPARDALAMGLIASCVPDDEYATSVARLVENLRTGPTLALARMKAAINHSSLPTLTQTLDYERVAQAVLQDTADYREGVQAFNSKRPAVFAGR